MSMGLTKEVLPPRQAPCEPRDPVSETQVRAAITRTFWTTAAIVGLVNVAACMLEMGL